MVPTKHASFVVDVPDDLKKVEKIMATDEFKNL